MKLSEFLKENGAYESFVKQFEVDFITKRDFITIGNGLYWDSTTEGSDYWIELQEKFAKYEDKEFDMDWLFDGEQEFHTVITYDEFMNKYKPKVNKDGEKTLEQIIEDSIKEALYLDSLDKDSDSFNKKKIESKNNGGITDYYQLDSAPFKINDFDDFAEWRNLNGNQFNMGKVMWTFNIGRHSGTTYVRDLNKIKHYADRELLRLRRESK